MKSKNNFRRSYLLPFAALFFALFLPDCAKAQQKPVSDGMVFHFNFASADGQKEIADETGQFKCISRVGNFAVEHGGVRVDTAAQFMVPAEKLPPLQRQLTLSLWINKAFFGYTSPLFFKGIHSQPIQFSFSVAGRVPQFMYKNVPNQNYWKGLYTTGNDYASNQAYVKPEWQIQGEEARVQDGVWSHLVVTFDEGTIKIYRDNRLVAEAKSDNKELLVPNNEPLWLGCERVPNDPNNYLTANAILNDMRLYSRALSPTEIGTIYDAESPSYSKTNLIAAGEVMIPPNNSYVLALHPDYDPDFKRTLPRTARYEKQIPAPQGNIKSAALKESGGQVGLAINGEMQAPVLLLPLAARDNKLRLAEIEGVTRDFAAANVDLVSTGSIPPTFWTGDGQYDWPLFDSVFEAVLKANPRAKIMASVFLRPPSWFFWKYPDEMERYLDASGGSHIFYTAGPFASQLWRQTSLKMLHDVVTHIETSPYADHVFGYLPAGGDAGEWYWSGSFTGGWPGYSVATEKDFQRWLAQKYPDNTALQTAWNDKNITLQTAKVPPVSLREASEYGLFRLSEKVRQVFDYRAYMNEITYQNIAETCRAIKSASSGKVVGIYYGYTLLYAGKQATMQMGGLQNLGKVFENPDIDFIATPIDYVHRRGGETGLNINGYNGSARLHRKMLWQENDLRTHFLVSPNFGRTADMKETLAVLNRGLGHVLTNGGGIWWNLLEGNALFHEATIMDGVAQVHQASQEALQADRATVAEVAFFLDEPSANFTGVPKNNFMDRLTWGTYEAASMMGAPSDFYLLDDIKNPQLPKYKLYVFLNAFQINEATRKAIAQKVRKNNAVAVWCYAPGFIGPNGFETQPMKKLTGMALEKEDAEKTLSFEITDAKHPIMKWVQKLDAVTVAPSFYVSDKAAKTLASTPDGKPVIAAREFGDWRSVYSLAPLSKELLMGLCDYAGVPVYSRSFDVFNANKSYLMLHSTTAGEKTITLPRTSKVTEILTNKVVARDAKTFSETLEAGVTRIYRIQ